MSSSRTLSEKWEWDAESRAIELLDWETKPEDFDRLFEFVIGKFESRDGVSRGRLFAIISESDLRREVRVSAARFQEKFISLPMFIYMRLRFLVFPEAKKERRDHDA